ncbi:MAG: FadR family transcriptional regulator [Chloroflexi bacterium]|nr:MAG: FadR family transcriptional regulator [Chloroflexota bacterium]
MLTNLKRETLSDQIAARLMQHIVNENLQPGDVLPSEHKLADLFGVSRPVVREALRSLSAQGIVMVVSGKGAIVQPVDDQLLQIFFKRMLHTGQSSVIDLMAVRKQLECYGAVLAAKKRLPEEAVELQNTIEGMKKALQSKNLDSYAELDVTFHMQIATATHNEPLSFLIQSIRIALKQIVMQGLQQWATQEQLNRVQEVHENIFTSIHNQNRDEAEKWMTIHFDEAIANLVQDDESNKSGDANTMLPTT